MATLNTNSRPLGDSWVGKTLAKLADLAGLTFTSADDDVQNFKIKGASYGPAGSADVDQPVRTVSAISEAGLVEAYKILGSDFFVGIFNSLQVAEGRAEVLGLFEDPAKAFSARLVQIDKSGIPPMLGAPMLQKTWAKLEKYNPSGNEINDEDRDRGQKIAEELIAKK